RLNVAITRAKYNVKLVGSIDSTDIDLNRASAEGAKLLRGYIEYAKRGPAFLESEIDENDVIQHDSPFEESVFKFLDHKGYKIATQVGCSGYRIDMAVKHPTLSGRYVLGIECDGASYHSARTARERDRLRQDVLENMGWKIYRIWSTDWIKDPITEGKRLVDAIEDALDNFIDANHQFLHTQKDESEVTDFIIELENENCSSLDNPYGFEEYKEADISAYHLSGCGPHIPIEAIKEIITDEYPIHFDRICQLVSPLMRREKATSVVKDEVRRMLAVHEQCFIKQAQFYYPKGYTTVHVRTAGIRPIQHISGEELSEGMLMVVNNCIGVSKEKLINETIRAFGFNRRGAKINDAMNVAYNKLIRTEKIREFAGKVFDSEHAPKYASEAIMEGLEPRLKATVESAKQTVIYNKPELIQKGSKVYHKTHGSGTVTQIANGLIHVSCDDGNDRKYQFPQTVHSGMLGYI
ncbi:MAG TPA: hypothetical protein PLM10_07265, partial [Saccharofermentans sp.]|nr:hypothetical protein [Saccharofermentans sp.]